MVKYKIVCSDKAAAVPAPTKEITLRLVPGDDGSVTLQARLNGGYNWNVLEFTPEGRTIRYSFASNCGLETDSRGQLVIRDGC